MMSAYSGTRYRARIVPFSVMFRNAPAFVKTIAVNHIKPANVRALIFAGFRSHT